MAHYRQILLHCYFHRLTQLVIQSLMIALSMIMGHPGYYNAAIDEIFVNRLIPMMFSHVVTSKRAPEEALTQADQEVRKIYDKWRSEGKI